MKIIYNSNRKQRIYSIDNLVAIKRTQVILGNKTVFYAADIVVIKIGEHEKNTLRTTSVMVQIT
jgi:hypothetical protein